MNELNRIKLFYSVCMPVRVGIILLLYFFPYQEMSILTFLISFGFLYRWFFPTKIGFFKGHVFWSRFFHFIMYLIASILLVIPETKDYAYIALIIDVAFSFLLYTDTKLTKLI